MNEHELKKLLEDKNYLEEKIEQYLNKGIIMKEGSVSEIKGHLEKARHNLGFIGKIGVEYNDWALVACYYASYHAALALILSKGYFSKNHDATLCILIKHFYKSSFSKEEIEMLNMFDAEDILSYVESKQKREEASYSTRTRFEQADINNLKTKTTVFVNKVDRMIKEGNR